jgi:hypothetical protein
MLGFSTAARTLGRAGPLLLPLLAAAPLSAQQPDTAAAPAAVGEPAAAPVGGRAEVFAGSELERYLRVLQLGGIARPYPWTLRAFGVADLDRILPADSAAHPWRDRYALSAEASGSKRFAWVAPQATTVLNTTYPYGGTDGAVWAGRGLTGAVQAGFAARYGPLSLTVAPVAFVTGNAGFELAPNGETDEQAYGDWRFYRNQIDLPQRFGEGAYARLDPGQSSVRLDLAGLTAGFSTANEYWGPAVEQPIVLGNNAPGFAHAFFGTSTPLNVGIGRTHARIVWGRLEPSAYSPMPKGRGSRFMSGLVASFSPRGVPGLELGGARFFHVDWPTDGIGPTQLLKPFEGLLKDRLVERQPDPDRPGESLMADDNQLASVFVRWAFPASGFEIYGEYGKEDHNYDQRDLILNYDHNGGYLLGFQKLWRNDLEEWTVLRGEVLNLQVSHVARARSQSPFYQHSAFRQGHTHRGQLLGAPAGYGGAGSIVALDRYHSSGRWTVLWQREVRGDDGNYWLTRSPEQPGVDVQHAIGVERVLFRSQWDLHAGSRVIYERNRDFRGGNTFNLSLSLGARLAI